MKQFSDAWKGGEKNKEQDDTTKANTGYNSFKAGAVIQGEKKEREARKKRHLALKGNGKGNARKEG